MIRKKTTLRAKSGGAQTGNGAGNVRALIDEATYREFANTRTGLHKYGQLWDAQYSGWSNPSRPRDYAISLRPAGFVRESD